VARTNHPSASSSLTTSRNFKPNPPMQYGYRSLPDRMQEPQAKPNTKQAGGRQPFAAPAQRGGWIPACAEMTSKDAGPAYKAHRRGRPRLPEMSGGPPSIAPRRPRPLCRARNLQPSLSLLCPSAPLPLCSLPLFLLRPAAPVPPTASLPRDPERAALRRGPQDDARMGLRVSRLAPHVSPPQPLRGLLTTTRAQGPRRWPARGRP
jgi:hypothetical protein